MLIMEDNEHDCPVGDTLCDFAGDCRKSSVTDCPMMPLYDRFGGRDIWMRESNI